MTLWIDWRYNRCSNRWLDDWLGGLPADLQEAELALPDVVEHGVLAEVGHPPQPAARPHQEGRGQEGGRRSLTTAAVQAIGLGTGVAVGDISIWQLLKTMLPIRLKCLLTFIRPRTSACAVWTIVPASTTSILHPCHCSMLPHLEGVLTPCPSRVPPPHGVAIWSPDHQTCQSSKSAISRGSIYKRFYTPRHLYLIARMLILDILPGHLLSWLNSSLLKTNISFEWVAHIWSPLFTVYKHERACTLLR